jgi:hypothetical protein
MILGVYNRSDSTSFLTNSQSPQYAAACLKVTESFYIIVLLSIDKPFELLANLYKKQCFFKIKQLLAIKNLIHLAFSTKRLRT